MWQPQPHSLIRSERSDAKDLLARLQEIPRSHKPKTKASKSGAVIGGANQGSTQMGSTHEYPSKPLMKEKRGKTCKHLGQVQFLEG